MWRRDGGEITSDAGGILLHEVEKGTRVLSRMNTDAHEPEGRSRYRGWGENRRQGARRTDQPCETIQASTLVPSTRHTGTMPTWRYRPGLRSL